MQNVFKVIALYRFFTVKEFKEFLDKLRSNIDFQGLDINCFIDYELKEELIDTLNVWPCGVNLIFLFNTGFREAKVCLFHIGKWTEDILLNHLHDFIKIGYDQCGNILLISEHLLKFINSIKSLSLLIIILLIINLPCP